MEGIVFTFRIRWYRPDHIVSTCRIEGYEPGGYIGHIVFTCKIGRLGQVIFKLGG